MPSFSKIIWMSTGGTGGHLFPALACADEMLRDAPDLKICLIGGGMKSALSDTLSLSFPYIQIPCGSLSFSHPFKSVKGMLAIGRGLCRSYLEMRRMHPDALIGFGSYFSLPPLLAGRLMRIPLFLHAADSVPGRVIRYFSRYARCTFFQFNEAADVLQGIKCPVKMALRPSMCKGRYSREEAAELLGVRADLPTLLIFGGSQGAKRLNELLYAALQADLPVMQILHYTGDASMIAPLQDLYAKKGHHSLVKVYETRMDCAWTIADSAITRSGASTVAELIEHEVPSLLIPYPHAADNHQEKNARALLSCQAGVEMVVEKEITPEFLVGAIKRMMHIRTYAHAMQEALRAYKRQAPQATMAQLLLKQLYG